MENRRWKISRIYVYLDITVLKDNRALLQTDSKEDGTRTHVKKVLVVGMLDSIHLARWLKQFNNSEIQITILPSSRFRKLHHDIEVMLQNREIIFYKRNNGFSYRLSGYKDFLQFEVLSRIFRYLSRAKSLGKYLKSNQVDIVHLIEIQHAGYLYLDAKIQNKTFNLIMTNYGSDIFYFNNSSLDKSKISRILKQSDFYSAECRRDYALAKELGFAGIELPLMPNAGGFKIEANESQKVPLEKRKSIYVKGYGGKFGLGGIALEVIAKILNNFDEVDAIVVSLTSDLEKQAKELSKKYRNRIKFYRIASPISQEDVLSILGNSIICIGASRSDGISTTFLEALISGAIPIQTNTSCASEWTDKGFFAKIVGPSKDEIYEAASSILTNPANFQSQSKNNMSLARLYLDTDQLSLTAQTFYQIE